MNHPKIDWEKAKAEYLEGDISMRQLAFKYGVSANAVQLKAKRDNWARQRERHLLEKHAKEADETINEVYAKKGDVEYVASGMEKEIKRCLELMDAEGVSAQTRYSLIQCVKVAWALVKDIRGILSRADAEKLYLARQELDMRREEHNRMMDREETKNEPIRVIIGGRMSTEEGGEDGDEEEAAI